MAYRVNGSSVGEVGRSLCAAPAEAQRRPPVPGGAGCVFFMCTRGCDEKSKGKMPQLDPVTFFSQFFWLCVFFFGFYFVISKDFLPKLGRILKFRKKKIHLSTEGVGSAHQENEKVHASSKALVENGLNTSSNLLLSHLQNIDNWLSSVITNTNKKQLENCNTLYVEWVGDNSIRQQLALQAAAPLSTPRMFASILAEKCKNRRGNIRQNISGTPLSRPDSLDAMLKEKTKRVAAGQKSRAAKK